MNRSRLPAACGDLSTLVVRALTDDELLRPIARPAELEAVADPLTNRDFQLSLWMLYELHYDGFEDVDPRLEWDPLLLAARGRLEQRFEEAVRDLTGPSPDDEHGPGALVAELTRLTASPDLSPHLRMLRDDATREQFCEFLATGAVFKLHESDPQALVLPRVHGPAKAALAELLFDEFGNGRPDRVHATLYARALESVGMSTDIASYVEAADAATLAAVNLMSLFGLNRRLRGAALGHLAAYEATSSLPCQAVVDGALRLGLPDSVVDYFDEHVEADAVHEQLAIREICGALVESEPALADDVLFGARACLAVDGLSGKALLARGREPAPDRVPESVA